MRKLAAALVTLVSGLTVAYLIILALLLVSYLLVSQSEIRGVLLSALALLLFLSIVLLPLALLAGRRRLALMLIVPLVASAALHLPMALVRSPAAPSGAATLTVLTWNIKRAESDLDSLIEVLRTADADVVALQEVDPAVAERFAAAFADVFSYQAWYPDSDSGAGMGVMSRYPLTDEEYWRNEHLAFSLGHLRVVLDLHGAEVALYNSHPVPPISLEKGLAAQPHSAEVGILLDRARREPRPVLIVGDLNMTPHFDEYRLMVRDHTDAFTAAGPTGLGFTFPTGQRLPLPRIERLDYIFHDDNFRSLETILLPRSASSDHLPLMAELEFVPGKR